MDNHPSLTIMNDNISILSIVLAQPDRIIWIDERLLDMINNDNEFENNILNKDELDKKEAQKKKQHRKHVNRGTSTTRRIALGFLIVICIGTLLLSLPISVVGGESDFLTALFTATTSVCVTGLVVVDTFSHWTIFGKIVILILIQLGGLGVVVFTSTLLLVLGKKVTLKDRITIQDAFNLNNPKGMVVFIKKVVMGTLVVEGIGMLLYMISFVPEFGFPKGAWFSLFNAVSAFCNAGMDIIGPNSLMDFNSSPAVLLTTAFLIFMGGIGFVVWFDFIDVIKQIKKGEVEIKDIFKKLGTHSKIVLSITLALILIGWVLIFTFEYGNPATIGDMSLGDKLLNSLFQSITLRTAGFAAIDQGGLTDSSVLLCLIWMIIGGSPAGTAGGIKTVTVAVILFTVVSVINGRKETVIFNKSVNPWLIRRVIAVTFISLLGFVVLSIALLMSNQVVLTDAIFETASAIGTVGLSRGITSSLNTIGRIIIIIGMYLGRIGPISMLIAFNNNYTVKNSIHYAEAEIIVG